MKPGPETRFVAARKHSARVRRFELRPEHDLLRARSLFLIRRVIKADPGLVDLAGELEVELMISRYQLHRDRQRLLFFIQRDCRNRNRFSIDRCFADLNFERVENDLLHRLSRIEFDRFRSGERPLRDIRRDADRVIFRRHILRQLSRCAGEVERFLGG